MTTELVVPDASCGHCKATIEPAVSSLTGVTSAELDLDSKRLVVEHAGDVGESELHRAITEAGYTPAPA